MKLLKQSPQRIQQNLKRLFGADASVRWGQQMRELDTLECADVVPFCFAHVQPYPHALPVRAAVLQESKLYSTLISFFEEDPTCIILSQDAVDVSVRGLYVLLQLDPTDLSDWMLTQSTPHTTIGAGVDGALLVTTPIHTFIENTD